MQWCTLSMLPVLPQRVASKRITLKLDFLILNLGWWVSENQVSYEHGIGMGGVQKPCLKEFKCDVASQRVIGIPWDCMFFLVIPKPGEHILSPGIWGWLVVGSWLLCAWFS